MLKVGIVEDDVGALIEVIRNLIVLDRSRYDFEIVPVLLSDPVADTEEAINERVREYGMKRLEGFGGKLANWPTIIQKGMLCPADHEQRAEILKFLREKKVDAIICDSWLGKDTALESKFNEKELTLAGLMLLDEAEKEGQWRGKCWIMTMHKQDVFEHLKDLLEEDGWRPERFNLFGRFLRKNLILETAPGACDIHLERAIDECLAYVSLTQAINLPVETAGEGKFGLMIGRSQPMLEVYKKIQMVAPRDVPVVIHGESGVGKELVARELCRNSPRAEREFVAINCAAISENLFESELFGHERGSFTGASSEKKGFFQVADKGTLFFDEIGDLNYHVQAKLLRALQEKEIIRVGGTRPIKLDVRVLAATNKDLEEEVREKRFRGDLYYRISGFDIRIPPLRERREDVALLCDHFLRKQTEPKSSHAREISADAMETLNRFSWPGNVRQLEKLIEKAIMYAENEPVITSSNEAIAEIAELLRRSQPPLAQPHWDVQPGAAVSTNPRYKDMSAQQIWTSIKDGKVTKTLPQWAKAIGVPKTLEVVDEVIHYCHGHLPTDNETQKHFGQKYRAWNGCRLRYLKGESE
jgi:DNA-binding NtrC family response regulator